jgi:translation initiation factor 6
MIINKLNIFGNDNIGVYIFSNDKYTLIPRGLDTKTKEIISETLKTELVEAEVARSPLLGVFINGNNDIILVPKIVTNDELINLKENLKDVRVEILDVRATALGNVILMNNYGALLYPEFTEVEISKISQILGLQNIRKGGIANIITVGAVGVITNKGGVVHIDASEEELKNLEKLFNVKLDVSTVNFGSVFLRSGLVANSNGALVGSSTTGPEILRIQKALKGGEG